MKNTLLLTTALCALVSFPTSNRLLAAEITFSGGFEGGFADIADALYFNDESSFSSPLSPTPVLGIPKFDSSLGTLTDIVIFIADTEPIFYNLESTINVAEVDNEMPLFSANVTITGNAGVYYENPSSVLTPVLTDTFAIDGFCEGVGGDGTCLIGLHEGGTVDGIASLFSLDDFDLADFVGSSEDIDSLFVRPFLDDTADFEFTNAMLSPFAEVFLTSGASADDFVRVTYTFTPIPEPSSLFLLASALTLLGGMRRRM